MTKAILSILIAAALCLFAGRGFSQGVGIVHAQSVEQETDQEMQQGTPSDQDREPGQEMPQGGEIQSEQGTDQGTGSVLGEPAPPDNQ